jgi:hypothetical protein
MSTIITILGTDVVSSSRTDINTNFSNLNTDKYESGDAIAIDDATFTAKTAPAHAAGLLYYDTDTDSLVFYNAEAEVALNIGEEIWETYRNETGVTITDGSPVYLTGGSSGNKSLIALARSDSASTAEVVGVATHAIENNSNGRVTIVGKVRDLDTSAWTEGDRLYVSASVAGDLVNVVPVAPNFPILVAHVERSHATQGEINVSVGPVDVTNGMVIQDLDINNDLTVLNTPLPLSRQSKSKPHRYTTSFYYLRL